MRIGYVSTPGRGESDRLLGALARRLHARGLRLAGVVQVNKDRPDCDACDMDVQVLPDGPEIRISQSLGQHSNGCRLDASALEQAVGLVSAQLAQGADVLLINKFGKHEADGRGFRPLIGDALMEGIPVLTGVNAKTLETFLTFSDGLSDGLSADLDALEAWVLEQIQSAVAS